MLLIILTIILTPRPPIVFTITAAIAGLCPTFKQQFVIATDGLLVAGLGTNVFRGGKGALDTCSMFMQFKVWKDVNGTREEERKRTRDTETQRS